MWMIPDSNSRVTAELREVLESGVDLWDFDYPSYYEGDEKKAFEQKVIDHFYLRQIGAETVGRFLHYFRRTMREIMPLYIQRYESVELMQDPRIKVLDNYMMVEEYEEQTTGSASSSGETSASTTSEGTGEKGTTLNSKGTGVHSDTPQNSLNLSVNLDSDGVETLTHASDTQQDIRREASSENSSASETSETTGTSSDSSESSGTVKHKLTRSGNVGVTTWAQMLEGYRQSFLNIDMEIIEELESCFLGVY